MKKILIKILIAVLIFSGFSYAVYHSKEHEDCENDLHVHVHEINAETYKTNTKCPSCGAKMILETVIYEPSCTDTGEGTGRCSKMSTATCPAEGYPVILEPLGHNYVAVDVIEPTCTESGETFYECHRCYDSMYSEKTAPLGHNYIKKVTKEATCEEDGINTYTCSRCSDSYTKKVSALGHDIEYE